MDNFYTTDEDIGAGSVCVWNGTTGECVASFKLDYTNYGSEGKAASQLCDALNTTVVISKNRRQKLMQETSA